MRMTLVGKGASNWPTYAYKVTFIFVQQPGIEAVREWHPPMSRFDLIRIFLKFQLSIKVASLSLGFETSLLISQKHIHGSLNIC
jgi:hypothetical protein